MLFSARTVVPVLSVASVASALSLHSPQNAQHSGVAIQSLAIPSRRPFSSAALRLTPIDDETGDGRIENQLDKLAAKRKQIALERAGKPKDDEPKTVEDMSDEEMAAFVESAGDSLFDREYMPDFKTGLSPSAMQQKDEDAAQVRRMMGGGDKDKEDEVEENDEYFDYTSFEDENEMHIPNRLGFTTAIWGDEGAGFLDQKLKKKQRKAGRFNTVDLKKAFDKLQNNGISFIETSEGYARNSDSPAESLVKKCMKNYEPDSRPVIASTFPSPWSHAFRTKSMPRYGANAIVKGAEASLDRLGMSTMALYQFQNTRYYIGGTTAIANGLLEVIGDGHANFVGVKDMNVSQLAKLQRKMRADGEVISSNQIEFSITNRKNMKIIETCRKLEITPIAYNVLDGGLASGKFTAVNPTGGKNNINGATGPFPTRKLQKLDPLFKVMEGMREKINKRIKDELNSMASSYKPNVNTDVSSTQIAINYAESKGCVPLVSVTTPKQAKELLGCIGWTLSEEEVAELDKVCTDCGC